MTTQTSRPPSKSFETLAANREPQKGDATAIAICATSSMVAHEIAGPRISAVDANGETHPFDADLRSGWV
jgi:hypothetical protein